MPDKPHQDWTDDAAFWDEAWTDMSARLDQTERKYLISWRRRMGIALVLLLSLIVYLQSQMIGPVENAPESPDTPSASSQPAIIAATPPAEAPAVALTEDQVPEGMDAASTDSPDNAFPSSGKIATSGKETPKSSFPTVVNTRRRAPSPDLPAAATIVNEGSTKVPPTSSEQNPAVAEAAEMAGWEQEAGARTIPSALSPLKGPATAPLTWISETFPPELSAFKKNRRRSALALEAGVNTGGLPDFGGNYLGLRYAIPISRRLSFPIGLRYQHHNWRISSLEDRPEFEQVANPSTPDMDGRSFLNDLSAAELDQVITNQVTLRAGLEYLAGKHWTFSGGTGVHYFLSGRGPSADDDGARLVGLNFNRWGRAEEDALAVTGGSSGSAASPPIANSLGLSLHAGAGYRLGNRWTIFGEVSVLATPIYRGQPASVERSRLGLGIRYRLR